MTAESQSLAELIAELSGLFDASTPGPWRLVQAPHYGLADLVDADDEYLALALSEPNARLIAALLNTAPTILSRLASVEALERRVAAAQRLADQWSDSAVSRGYARALHEALEGSNAD